MSQTEEAKPNPEHTPEQVERVRKIFVCDLSLQQKIHTVFRVAKKSRHLARSGKPFLALSLVDKTGTLPARIFDNVETAEAAFQEDDYLLVKGTVINFKGKPQLVVEQLERLAPEPINPSEFVPPPPLCPIEEKQTPLLKTKPPKNPKTNRTPTPTISQALETFGLALEAFVQEKIEQQLALLALPSPPIPSTTPTPPL
ncbi:MAG: OB-fold nucleic acid binding domain-containing protein, partial [Proteobacteria bacterium]|nr:OB-fold nucleic acid binding domain-containing protein [Pseudomonadota bacterium]